MLLPGQAGRASWEQVTSQDIQRWMAWLLDRYSSAYASNQYRALQQFFKWLAAEDQLPDPMAGLAPPRIIAKLVPVFTPEELFKAGAGVRASASRSAATPRSSRCSPRPASGYPSWPAYGTTLATFRFSGEI
jgi:site-specific recombinase XerD